MPKWTKEQQLAIDIENTNIIVSAGAGSGKTAVLSERVIRKLEQGVDVDYLLILTFTKAAAFEMMIRIRNKIKERPHLEEQLKKLDSSYITTFDSFSLSLVKKYHYLLNITRDIKITNQTIIDKERKRILDELFNEYYEQEDERFLRLLDIFTVKDDEDIKNLILSMNKKLDLKYDKIPYLMNYLKNYQELTKELKVTFYDYLRQKIEGIKEQYLHFSNFVNGEYLESASDEVNSLFTSRTYDEIKEHANIKFKNLPRGSEEEVKKEKEKLVALIKELQDILIYEDEKEIDVCLTEQENYLEIIIEIILKLDQAIYDYKYSHDAYEFTDISKMAIKLVKDYEEIRKELKYYFNEIMVDEYQDTSDLQEEFITSIENDNVYMVGDIKQSIYRFRNANPYIFKNKYDAYSEGKGGFKIDLMKNFRSRKEVLQNINDVFDPVMDNYLGGCNYRESHRMVFGNTTYEEKKPKQNADFEVYNYVVEPGYSKDEMEAFIILKDILEKVKSHYQVIDRETFELRDVEYQDFAILMDRATKFDLYKKIFEYYHIPMAVYKDTTITKEDDIYIFSSLLKLVYHIYHKNYDKDFEYAYLGVARSYLTNMSDREIFEIIQNKTYQASELYQKIVPIVNEYPLLNGESLLERILVTFNFYEKQILVGNMEHLMARVSYLKSLFQEMGSLGYSLDDAIIMFNEMVEEGQDIKVSFNEEQTNAVKIMTIHKSKGLEFPVLYMAGLSNSFNIRDLNDKFIFDNKYGFILPFYKDEEKTSIAKVLMKNTYLEEEISEKIRLFYVALTRAREKMILLTNNEKEEYDEVLENVTALTRIKYRSFLDLLKSIWSILIPYKREINTKELGLSKEYNFIQKFNYEKNLAYIKDKFTYKEIKVPKIEESNIKFSKTVTELLTQDNLEAIELGLRFHEIFETIDFKKPDYSLLTDFEKKKVKSFLKNQVLTNLETANIMKEYEFAYRENNELKHGIIDLLIEFDDKILIIDYKLKHVLDNAYKKQLRGYQEYIGLKSNKPIYVYLYSILDEKFTEIK